MVAEVEMVRGEGVRTTGSGGEMRGWWELCGENVGSGWKTDSGRLTS